MNLALISCMVLSRDISCSMMNSSNMVHPFFLKQGLHDTPAKLKEAIQSKIDEIEEMQESFAQGYHGKFDERKKFTAIIIGYGLCSNGVVGLKSKTLPLVIPRCDDCIALFLGSQNKYLEYFNKHKGIYWLNKGWVENGCLPSKKHYDNLYNHYVDEYDEDTATYLIEQETAHTKSYESLFFIKSDKYDDSKERDLVQQSAEDFDWNYMETTSDLTFINDLINGNWDDRFLICKPGQTVTAEYTGKKISAKWSNTSI